MARQPWSEIPDTEGPSLLALLWLTVAVLAFVLMIRFVAPVV